MKYHIVLPRALSAEEIGAVDIGGDRPRMGMSLLASELDAVVHAPVGGDGSGGVMDALRAKVVGPASVWAMARSVAAQVDGNDVVFCGSEAGGLQVAEACGSGSQKPKQCMFVHNLDRPRGRAALKLFGVADKVELMLACSDLQTAFLREYLQAPPDRVGFIWDHTDTEFFSPGPASGASSRPRIVSVGLEQRDYITLAAATADLDVDVRISGFSEDANVLRKTFPVELPRNMSRKFYPWPDLVQLYRDADIVVVSVHENKYAAGVQSLMEGMACGRPVIATATAGLKKYLDPEAVVGIPPGDAGAMRAAILSLLADPARAAVQAANALALARERHRIERYVDEIARHLRRLATA